MGYALKKQQKGSGVGYLVRDIIRASKDGDVELVEKILEADSSLVNAQEEGTDLTPLHIAAFQTNFKLAEVLLNVEEIKPRMYDQFKRTPLDLAHVMKNEEMIVFLRKSTLPPEFSSEIPKPPKP